VIDDEKNDKKTESSVSAKDPNPTKSMEKE
jgi:hypothetical protein